MSLEKYNKKRNAATTPEPFDDKAGTGAQLHFVVQKHDASHLHYDFRLEMNGVLKSWAIPKGPSLNPADKRLAMMVEDHPYDYKNFEGIIPKGNYGAGTVIVWDEGTYTPLDETATKRTGEQSLLRQLKAGSLKFKLDGKKLKGEFALVKASGMAANAWLLIKHKDKYAIDTDITKKDKSVISNKTIASMAKEPAGIYGKQPKKGSGKKATQGQHDNRSVTNILRSAPNGTFPKRLAPMLSTLADAPFDNDEWQYEVKWDGYRAITFRKGKSAEIRSRNDQSFNGRFYPVLEAVKQWDVDAVVDGEIVVVDSKGIARFNRLQNWHSEADGTLQYYLFDILWYNGKDLKGLPLQDRVAILKAIAPVDNGMIRTGFSVTGSGKDFFHSAEQLGLEGMIAKRLNSPYLPGSRSPDWLKIKIQKRQEVIITGYTRNAGSPRLFSALLLGTYNKDKLQYAGKVGTGFSDKMQEEMMQQFRPLIVKQSPLEFIPDYNKPSRFRPVSPPADTVWLKPRLVCEISFTEITEDGVFRHPSFKGMRVDKPAKEVIVERATPPEKLTKPVKESLKKKVERKAPVKTSKETIPKKIIIKLPASQAAAKKIIVKLPRNYSGKELLSPADNTQTHKINGKELSFTNLDKLFWPEARITKRDLLNYYYRIASYMLPYIKGRPQSLYRFPNGYKGKSFYQKDVTGKVPDWATTYLYHSEGHEEDRHFLVAKDEASLLYMVNAGCIEINPWSSTIKKPDNPDWCLLDLDPGAKTTFNKVIDAANVLHDLLEQCNIPSFPKTSGSTGMHIYIPLGSKYSYEQSKEFARIIVTIAQQETARFTTIERQVNERSGKLYLDFLQNRPQATLAAPYSVRPRPKATVSMPLAWEEVKHGLKMDDFTLKNVPVLLEERGDLFKGVLGKGINMIQALKQLDAIS